MDIIERIFRTANDLDDAGYPAEADSVAGTAKSIHERITERGEDSYYYKGTKRYQRFRDILRKIGKQAVRLIADADKISNILIKMEGTDPSNTRKEWEELAVLSKRWFALENEFQRVREELRRTEEGLSFKEKLALKGTYTYLAHLFVSGEYRFRGEKWWNFEF